MWFRVTDFFRLKHFFGLLPGPFRLWISAMVKLCDWEDMAYLYGGDCFTENSPPYHSMVYAKVQTLDCCKCSNYVCFLLNYLLTFLIRCIICHVVLLFSTFFLYLVSFLNSSSSTFLWQYSCSSYAITSKFVTFTLSN